MKLACIVLAYNLPAQLALLLKTMEHPQVRLYVHVDKRKPTAPFAEALQDAPVTWLRRHPSRWGSAECVDAALEGLRAGREDGCDQFILISGQDFPLRPVTEIVGFFEANPERSYVEHVPVDVPPSLYHGRDRINFYTYTVLGRRETCIPCGEDASYFGLKGTVLNELLRLRTAFKPPRHFPEYAQPYSGATWWNMNDQAVEYVFEFMSRHPDYRRYHQHTRIPEEIFFQSILVGSEYPGEVVNDSLRYLRWGEPLNPLILTADDADDMFASRKLFARKFDGVPGVVLERHT